MGRTASHGGSSGPGDRADPAGPAAPGRTLARRYRLTGGRLGTGVAAADTRSRAAVQLDAVPLPELVTPFDQDREQLPLGGDGTAARALEQAAFVAGAVPDHPRLAQVFEVFAEDGCLWVVGEAVRGGSLAALLDRSGAVGPYRAAELAGDLVAALRAVHAVGLVHGNVTAESVTVCDDGSALLGGLALGAAQEALCGGPGSGTPGAGVPASAWTPARVRARDARRVVVGVAPERWAPEQRGPAADPGSADAGLAGPGQADAGLAGPGSAGPRLAGPRLAKEASGPGLAVGPAADAWALGALLHRMLTGGPLPMDEPGGPAGPEPAGSGPLRLTGGAARADAADPRDRRGRRGVKAPDPLGPLAPLVGRLLAVDPQARPGLVEVQAQLRQLLSRAPEPIGRTPMAALPPGPRRTALLGRSRPTDRPHHHAAPHHPVVPKPVTSKPVAPKRVDPRPVAPRRQAEPRRRPGLLGAALLGGVLLVVISTLVIAALVAG
jgi:eukaryotic-like serine/threonine-protein kinase